MILRLQEPTGMNRSRWTVWGLYRWRSDWIPQYRDEPFFFISWQRVQRIRPQPRLYVRDVSACYGLRAYRPTRAHLFRASAMLSNSVGASQVLLLRVFITDNTISETRVTQSAPPKYLTKHWSWEALIISGPEQLSIECSAQGPVEKANILQYCHKVEYLFYYYYKVAKILSN